MNTAQIYIKKLGKIYLNDTDKLETAAFVVSALNDFVRESGMIKRTSDAVRDLFIVLRIGFLRESAYVRAATCRALRYLIDCRTTLDLLLSNNLEWWILRSISLLVHSSASRDAANRGALTKEKESQIERTETIRLVRCMALFSPTRFISGALFGFLADFLNDYPQVGVAPPAGANQNANPSGVVQPNAHANSTMSELIEILRGTSALFCELAVLKPAAFAQRGGLPLLIRSLAHAIMNGDHKMVEALVLCCTYVLNDKTSRSAVRSGVEVEQLTAFVIDEQYLRSFATIDGIPVGQEWRGQVAASELSTHALLLVFRSWPSLFYCVAHRKTMIQPFVDVLFLQEADRLRVRLLHFLYALFYVRRPAKRYYDEFLSGNYSQSSAGQSGLTVGASSALRRFARSRRFEGASRFALADGFLVEEAYNCLHFRSNSRVNLLDSLLSVQLAAFVECGLLGAIACCALADDSYVAYLAAVLGGDLLRLANRLVPHAVLKRHYSADALVRAALRRLASSDSSLDSGTSSVSQQDAAADQNDNQPGLEAFLLGSGTASRTAHIRQMRARETIAYLRSREFCRRPPLKAHCVDCTHSLFLENVLSQSQPDSASPSSSLGFGIDEHERPVSASDARSASGSTFLEDRVRLAMPSNNFAEWNWRALLTLLRHLESLANESASVKSEKAATGTVTQKALGLGLKNAVSTWADSSTAATCKSSDSCLQKCVTSVQYTQLTRVFRQLAAFFRPLTQQFSKLEDFSVSSGAKGFSDEDLARESLTRLIVTCACCFFELLAAHSNCDSELQSLLDEFLREMHTALQRIIDPNWQPTRSSESQPQIESPNSTNKRDWRREDEAILSVANLQRSMSKYYILLLGRLFRTARGCTALIHHGIVTCLLELVGPQAHPVMVKLIISSLDFSSDNQARLVLAKALTTAQPDARVYATRFLRVLLRVNVPFFAHWAVALLCKQVYDAYAPVRCEALSIIDEACETPIAARTILDSSHLQVQDRGFYATLVFNHLLANPEGLQLLRRTQVGLKPDSAARDSGEQTVEEWCYVDRELARWRKSAAVHYARLVEERLYQALTSYEHIEQGEFVYSSASRRPPLRDVFLPPHLFGQLCKHLDGLRYLKQRRFIIDESCKRICEFAYSRYCTRSTQANNSGSVSSAGKSRSTQKVLRPSAGESSAMNRKAPIHLDSEAAITSRTSESSTVLTVGESKGRSVSFVQDGEVDHEEASASLSPSECDQIKAALWNIGHLGGTKLGFQFLLELKVLPLIVRICERCDLFSLKGVAYWSLCIAASTPEGADYLSQFGWVSVTAGRLSRYSDIIDEQSTETNVFAPTATASMVKDSELQPPVAAHPNFTGITAVNQSPNRRSSDQYGILTDQLGSVQRGRNEAIPSRLSDPAYAQRRASDFGLINPYKRLFKEPEQSDSNSNSDTMTGSTRNVVFDVEDIAEADETINDSDNAMASSNGDAANELQAEVQNSNPGGKSKQHRKCFSTDYRQLLPPEERRADRADSITTELPSNKSNNKSQRSRPVDDAAIDSRRTSRRGLDSSLNMSKSVTNLLMGQNGTSVNDDVDSQDEERESTASDGLIDQSLVEDNETQSSAHVRLRNSSNRAGLRPVPLSSFITDQSDSSSRLQTVKPKESFSRQRRSVAMVMHYHRSISAEPPTTISRKTSRPPSSASRLSVFKLHQNDDSAYRGICLPLNMDNWLAGSRISSSNRTRSSTTQSDSNIDSGRGQSLFDESAKSSRSTTSSSASLTSSSVNDRARLVLQQFGVHLDFSTSHEHAERCIMCVTKRVRTAATSVNGVGDSDNDDKVTEAEQNAVLAMANVVRLIVSLCNSITYKSSLNELRSVRERSAEVFTNACFFSEVCQFLATMHNVRIVVRRVVHELFARLDRAPFQGAIEDLLVRTGANDSNRLSEGETDDLAEMNRDSETRKSHLREDSLERRLSILTDPTTTDVSI